MIYKILIAEDDADIADILTLYLESNGYQVFCAENGNIAIDVLNTQHIDLAIFDIMIPGVDGFGLIKYVRKTSNIPILVLTAKIEDKDKILGLNLGADDYLTKPFNPLEIIARVNALLRRAYLLNANSKENQTAIQVGELVLDIEQLTLKKNGKDISLTPNEYKILSLMMKNCGRVYTKTQLSEAINGDFCINYENAVLVHISHLRDKIEEDTKNPKYIKNVRGLGYKIEKPQ